jgi:hypothetical protein
MPRFTIHMNGDRWSTLVDQLYDVQRAAKKLEATLKEAMPNMRNYYVNEDGPADFKADVAEITAHLKAVKDIEHWVDAAYARLAEQEGT